MIPTFVLLALAGGALRVALNWVLRRYFGLSLSFPQGGSAFLGGWFIGKIFKSKIIQIPP